MIETAADLQTFFDPTEFGVGATIALPGGPAGIVGTPATYAQRERPGANTNSALGSFMVGAADLDLQPVQFLTPWAPVATAMVECTLTIAAGPYAGDWRVRAIERDGDIARLLLNAR